MTGQKILIVDDESALCFSLRTLLEKRGYEVAEALDAASALTLLQGKKKKTFIPDAALIDIQLPDISGMKLLEQIKELVPHCSCIMITGFGSIVQSVEAMHKGAMDYLLKPFNVDELLLRIERSIENRSLKNQVGFLSNKVYGDWDSKYVIGPNLAMKKIYENLSVIANSPSATVFIHGETGTGKDVLANRIHYLSKRTSKPFVEINATALPPELLESELFGHEAGSFTGATARKKGLFEVANGGTLFLDEIGDMNMTMQAKLLRAIQEKTIRRVGGTENIEVDIRLITATNKDLASEVRAGKFREDLYFRLTVVPLTLPPLRERRDDIEVLANHFIRVFNREFSRQIKGLSPEALHMLQNYSWPGNVRELRNMMERTVLLECNTDYIQAGQLKFSASTRAASLQESKPAESPQTSPTCNGLIGQKATLEEVEKQHISAVLQLTQGNKNQAAIILGIDRTTLYNKIKRYF